MCEPLLTKRLHISGLTPSITPADLERRLSSFGKVKAMDGFGARDALGDPRKFGFVTIEIGAKELAKCLNVLSGSTWKGAKLRIGEAKPDFRERLAQINSQPPRPVRPKRTRARNYGHPSTTLPLTPLSDTAAACTPGWVVTPSGRVVRPMRMRPERPLEPMRSELSTLNIKSVHGKVKKRPKPPPVRARRRLIDPTKWDSACLKGVFLDNVDIPLPISKDALKPHIPVKRHDIVDEEDGKETDEEDNTDSDASSTPKQPARQPVEEHVDFTVSAQPSSAALATSSRTHEAVESINVCDETNAALAMLGKMFGDKEDWDGRECVDDMQNLEEGEAREKEMQVDGEDDIETVPLDFGGDGGSKTTNRDRGKGKEKTTGEAFHVGPEDGAEVAARERGAEVEETDPPVSDNRTMETGSRTSLKSLFAPREDASFSLLDHLDFELDLELDADIFGISGPSDASQEKGRLSQSILPTPTPNVVELPTRTAAAKARSLVTLDPSLPLLFPPPDLLAHPYTSNPTTTTRQHGTSACLLFSSETRIRGLHHLPPSITFTRSPEDTPESVRERWENDKSSLTHEWKKAWREAKGSRRGRIQGAGETYGGY